MSGNGPYLVEDNQVSRSTYLGIVTYGGAVIRNNQVRDTGAGTNVAFGIQANYGVTSVLGNDVVGVQPGTADNYPRGIGVQSGFVQGNRVSGLVTGGSGTAIGIELAQGVAKDNLVLQSDSTPGTGIKGNTSSTLCQDNAVQRYTVSYATCSMVGHNGAQN